MRQRQSTEAGLCTVKQPSQHNIVFEIFDDSLDVNWQSGASPGVIGIGAPAPGVGLKKILESVVLFWGFGASGPQGLRVENSLEIPVFRNCGLCFEGFRVGEFYCS